VITEAHAEHALVVAISNAWFERDPQLWYVGLELSKALDRTLLACIYQRLREVRDDVARQAFTEQRSIAEVARERLQNILLWRHGLTPRNSTGAQRIGADWERVASS
jgi:hypothetical protein